MKLEPKFTLGTNFWKTNNHEDLLILPCFLKLYELDNTKHKNISSDIMWAIYFIYDMNSKYATLELEKRISWAEKFFLKKENFFSLQKGNIKVITNECIATYIELQDNSVKRQLIAIDKKLDERRKFLDSTEYSIGTWEMLDKMQKDLPAIMKNRAEVEKLVLLSEELETKKGGSLSMLATGKLEIDREKIQNVEERKEAAESKVASGFKKPTGANKQTQ